MYQFSFLIFYDEATTWASPRTLCGGSQTAAIAGLSHNMKAHVTSQTLEAGHQFITRK